MSETPRFNLPLLDAAQAQKHVTVNEALARADALSAGRVEAVAFDPPTGAADGEVYIVGTAAGGDWAGRDGDLALWLNGGWVFVPPWEGATFWVAAERARATYDRDAWSAETSGVSAGGAATLTKVVEIDHVLAAGPFSVTEPVIPDKVVVLGVTARVIAEVEGAGSWSLGVAGSPDRYGTGYGAEAGAFAHGVTGQPQAYYGATPLEIGAAGGDFTGGSIRLAVHYFDLTPPRMI